MDDKSDYSFIYLLDAANRCILMKREDAMQESLSRSLMGTTDRAAPGVEPKPKGKGNGDKSKRERSKSAPPGGSKASAGKGKPENRPPLLCLPNRYLCTRKRMRVRAH